MKSNSTPIQSELVLVGGGHANIQVLKSFAMRPINGLRISLISDVLSAPYSGMLPGFIAGEYDFQEIHINLLHLCNYSSARFIQTKIMSVDTKERVIYCENRPNINYDLISINTGITSDFGKIDGLLFGFPCNDFSLVGKKEKMEGKFGGLYKYACKVLNFFEPEFFVAENVTSLSKKLKFNSSDVIETDVPAPMGISSGVLKNLFNTDV